VGKAGTSTASKPQSTLAGLLLNGPVPRDSRAKVKSWSCQDQGANPGLSGRHCSDMPQRNGKWQPCRGVQAPAYAFSLYTHIASTPASCLSLGLQQAEASIHCICSCSHNSDYLCTASRARYRRRWGGEQWQYSPAHSGCLCSASHAAA